MPSVDLSIVVPLYNEAESIPELYSWIIRVVEKMHLNCEIIFIDDGSTDGSWQELESIIATAVDPLSRKRNTTQTHAIKFMNNYGKSQALHAGFASSTGSVVITMDADLQDSPDEIPELYAMVSEFGYDIVSGWKKKRYDSVLAKNIPSKLFNWAARRASGLKLHDFNCGLKAYRSQVVKNIDVNGEMHRYIPVLAVNAGFSNITEKVVQHQARKYGTTKFGYERFIHGFLDLVTIAFLSRYGRRPMHFFGLLGVLAFLVGFVAALYIGVSKLYRMHHDLPFNLVTENPWFYISLTTMILGVLFFISGFLGELIIKNGMSKKQYIIDKHLS